MVGVVFVDVKVMRNKMKSKIFTDAELKSLNKRIKGEKKDLTGIFSGRVKPKILELFEWFKRKKELEKAIEPKKKDGKK